MHETTYAKYIHIFELLLQQEGINVNLQDHDGNTALHLAVLHLAILNKSSVNIKLLLQQKEIDVSLKNNEGKSAEELTNNLAIKNMFSGK